MKLPILVALSLAYTASCFPVFNDVSKRLLFESGHQAASADAFGGTTHTFQTNAPVVSGSGNSVTTGGAQSSQADATGGRVDQTLEQVEKFFGLSKRQPLLNEAVEMAQTVKDAFRFNSETHPAVQVQVWGSSSHPRNACLRAEEVWIKWIRWGCWQRHSTCSRNPFKASNRASLSVSSPMRRRMHVQMQTQVQGSSAKLMHLSLAVVETRSPLQEDRWNMPMQRAEALHRRSNSRSVCVVATTDRTLATAATDQTPRSLYCRKPRAPRGAKTLTLSAKASDPSRTHSLVLSFPVLYRSAYILEP